MWLRLAVTERFADAALTGGDGEDAGLDTRFAEGVLLAFGLEVGHQLGEFVLAHGADFDAGNQRGIGIEATAPLIFGDGLATADSLPRSVSTRTRRRTCWFRLPLAWRQWLRSCPSR